MVRLPSPTAITIAISQHKETIGRNGSESTQAPKGQKIEEKKRRHLRFNVEVSKEHSDRNYCCAIATRCDLSSNRGKQWEKNEVTYLSSYKKAFKHRGIRNVHMSRTYFITIIEVSCTKSLYCHYIKGPRLSTNLKFSLPQRYTNSLFF
jgi:hypothetical protein